MPLTVHPVAGRSDRRAFRLLPFDLYREDPDWVAPLHRDVRAFLDTERHPFYREADARFLLARRDGRVVGRVAAIDNGAHNRYHGERTGFFGFFETERDPSVAKALLDEAAAWLRERGLDVMRGPVSPSTNYVTGLLVAGDPGPPRFMMPHNPRWYGPLLEELGFAKAMDLRAWDLTTDTVSGSRWVRIADRVKRRTGARLRGLDLRHFGREVRTLIDLYEDAWSENWGFVPPNPGEVAHLARDLKPLLRSDTACFVTLDGREVGYFLGMPDYNRVLRKLRGRLLPTGVFRLLWSKRRIDTMRIMLMGIARAHQQLGLDALLYEFAYRGGDDGLIRTGEASWVLETNVPMNNALERSGARISRTYRVYERPLP